MRLPKSPTLFLTASLSLLVVSGCAPKERIRPLFPPAADIQEASERKPIAPVDIVTSAKANADYNIEVEAWGERVSRAGARICRWVIANGGQLPFTCPPALLSEQP